MNVTEINDGNFKDVINSYAKVVLDCYAPWCGPCTMLAPVIDELAAEEDQIKFCKINTEENPDTAERFDVMSIPTVLVFENGQLKNRVIGLKSKEELKSCFGSTAN